MGGTRIGSIAVQKSVAPAPSASPYATSGYSCVFGTGDATDCGSGNVISLPSASPSPLSLGFVQTTVGTFSTASPSPSPSASADAGTQGGWNLPPSQLQFQINGAGYSGPLYGLTLAPGTLPAWTISGGQEVTTLRGTATSGFGGFGNGVSCGAGVLSSLSLTLTDVTDGLTATLVSSGGMLSGAVTNSSGATVATISLDRSGTGTITYTNGTTSVVKDFVVLT